MPTHIQIRHFHLLQDSIGWFCVLLSSRSDAGLSFMSPPEAVYKEISLLVFQNFAVAYFSFAPAVMLTTLGLYIDIYQNY